MTEVIFWIIIGLLFAGQAFVLVIGVLAAAMLFDDWRKGR